MVNEFLWVEKYRPKTIDNCILPSNIKTTFDEIVNGGELHNMLLTGTPGLGKTTVAKALCNELNLDYLLINGSEESGIDFFSFYKRYQTANTQTHKSHPRKPTYH